MQHLAAGCCQVGRAAACGRGSAAVQPASDDVSHHGAAACQPQRQEVCVGLQCTRCQSSTPPPACSTALVAATGTTAKLQHPNAVAQPVTKGRAPPLLTNRTWSATHLSTHVTCTAPALSAATASTPALAPSSSTRGVLPESCTACIAVVVAAHQAAMRGLSGRVRYRYCLGARIAHCRHVEGTNGTPV